MRPIEFYIDRRKNSSNASAVHTPQCRVLHTRVTRLNAHAQVMQVSQSTNEIMPSVHVTAVAKPVVVKCWPKLVIKNSAVGCQIKYQDDHITEK